ncbi:MAG TPA: trehalose-phosphatase [Terriglobales bacterium]|nr:trehalose-phosphatase [Terriglobales bacterium]
MLKTDSQEQVDQFVQGVAHASQSLLMLDYDGTLAPFRLERDRAFPYPGVVPVLREIIRNGHTRIVIISGRDTSEAIPLLGIEPAPEVWGLHGLQRRRPNGETEMLPIDSRSLDALSDADRWVSYQQLRQKAELKTGSIAMHWRGLSDWEIEDVRGRVLMGWKPIAEHAGLQLLEFDGGVEIRVPDKDKGDAVRLLLDETEPDVPVAFLGDDATDERAFRAMKDRGLTVLVRPRWRQTAAQVWLKPPEELLHFLTRWLAASQRASGETAAAVSG